MGLLYWWLDLQASEQSSQTTISARVYTASAAGLPAEAVADTTGTFTGFSPACAWRVIRVHTMDGAVICLNNFERFLGLATATQRPTEFSWCSDWLLTE
jgi:hypothetical protein